jgi:hypothetical protein
MGQRTYPVTRRLHSMLSVGGSFTGFALAPKQGFTEFPTVH